MLTPTDKPIANFKDSFEPATEYRMSDARLAIPYKHTAVLTAETHGPTGATAWVRAWVSDEPEGKLAQARIRGVPVGDYVTLTIALEREATPELACMRFESGRLATKHTVQVELG